MLSGVNAGGIKAVVTVNKNAVSITSNGYGNSIFYVIAIQ